jgi:hypothetical protein
MFRQQISAFVLILALSLPILPINVTAQNAVGNSINLTIPKVFDTGKDELTKNVGGDSWKYDGDLTVDDSIKYGWQNAELDLKYKATPARGGGYMKIYLNDDSKSENLVSEYGSSPFPLSAIGDKLKVGENTLVLVYIGSTGNPSARTTINFIYKSGTTNPTIKVVSPAEGSVFTKDLDQDFDIELTNFSLENTSNVQKGKGKLNIYYNTIAPANLLATQSTSIDRGNGKSQIKFSTKDIPNLNKIPDSKDSKLIFVLTDANGNPTEFTNELKIKTNYNNQVNIGLPRISITDPRKDRTDLSINGDRKFTLQVDNFQILNERSEGSNEDGKGYLQVIVDNTPVKVVYSKLDFTFNELGLGSLPEGKKTVKVQLVNKDYTKLKPAAEDSVDVIFSPQSSKAEITKDNNQIQNNSWRIIVIVLTVILVLGGVAIIITKG